MKILKISFKNIHSLKGENCIDFTKKPLVDTGVFAIIGPTGAGKSTILDVVMLAIYGQMPRIETNISKSTIENFGAIITQNCNAAYAEVEYETQGITYRSKWSIRRNRNGNLNDYDMELANLTEGGKLIETYKSKVPPTNEKIIGLKYDQFLKSIILAQGSFSKFLKAKPEERTEMLEQITGSGIYRTIGIRAFEMAKKHREKYEENERLLETYKVLSDEERQNKITEKSDSEEVIRKIFSEIKVLDEKIKVKKNIQNFLNKKTELDRKLSELKNQIEDFKSQQKKLELHDKIINLKPELIEHQNLQKNITEYSDNLQKATQEKSNLLNNKKQCEDDIELLKNDLETTKSNFQNNNSEILKYRKINSELEVIENEKKLLQKNFKEINTDFSRLQKNSKDLVATLQNIDNQIINTKNWLNENQVLEQLVTDYVKIEQAMQNYSETKTKTSDFINKSIFKSSFEKKSWNNYQQFSVELTEKLQNKITLLKNKLNNFSLESLSAEYNKIILEIPIIEKQIEIYKSNKKISNKILGYSNNIYRISEEINSKNIEEQTTRQQIEINTKFIEELRIRYERQQLEAKYEQDRQKLKNGDECPLCGSVEHPFVEQNLVVEIDKTKLRLQNSEKKQKTLEKQFQNIISELSNKKSTLAGWQNNKTELENEQKELKDIFIKNNKKISCNFDISDIDNLSEFYNKLLENKTNIETEIEKLNEFEKLKSKQQILENITEKINSVFEFHIQAKNLLHRYTNYYKGVRNTDDILTKLRTQTKNYQQKLKDIDKFQNEKSSNKTLLNKNSEQIEIIEHKINDYTKKISDTNEKAKSLKNEIDVISKEKFENKTADEYEKITRKLIENKTSELSKLSNNLIQIITKNDENNKQIEILTKKIDTNKISFSEIDNTLKTKLEKLNILSVKNGLSALLEINEAEIIRNKQKELSETQHTINQTITENILLLENELQKDDETIKLTELETKIEDIEKQKQLENQRIGSINAILKTDEEQRAKQKVLKEKLEKLHKEFLRWEALNKLIGDAKGKRFAEIAHQFTLSELISISNKHLKRFSNRYMLDKTTESKNNLFVYDTYMGMAKRSVQTLSGGETFLVSLSMALALSDLASKQTKIESLFIDEGFGTLDEQTLDKALIRLEKLHSDDNRTIGIISHVAEIRERINTKIVVKKQSSGFSKLEIL